MGLLSLAELCRRVQLNTGKLGKYRTLQSLVNVLPVLSGEPNGMFCLDSQMGAALSG